MRHFFLGILLMVLCQISCRGNKQHNSDEKSFSQKQIEQKGMSQSSFPFPEIPATLTEPEARKAFLLTHYWDQFSFADTTLVNNRDVTEQGFVNFIALLADGTTPEELTRPKRRTITSSTPTRLSTTKGSTGCIWRRCLASCHRRTQCAPPTVSNWSW